MNKMDISLLIGVFSIRLVHFGCGDDGGKGFLLPFGDFFLAIGVIDCP